MNTSQPATHWAHIGDSTFVFGVVLLYWVYRVLGRWPFRIFLYPVVFMHWLLRPAVRNASAEYLQRIEQATAAIGHIPTRRDSLRHIALFAETILDKMLAVSGRHAFTPISFGDERQRLYAAAAAGQGGLIVTAHIGCLELCQTLAEQRGIIKLNILVHTRHAARFNQLLQRLGTTGDVNLIEVTEIGPGTAVMLAERVAAGEYVAITADRVSVFASKSVSVDFLDRPAPFPSGPWVLASLLKCPVWLLGCIHDGTGYSVHFEHLAERVVLPRGQRDTAIAAYVALYVQSLTRLLVRSPFDWFNFYPFWDQPLAKPRANN